ncbi:MAG: hypothetical protein AB1435_12305 [Chloroflexota bacterium]
MESPRCQLEGLPATAEGTLRVWPDAWRDRLRLLMRRTLSYRAQARVRRAGYALLRTVDQLRGRARTPVVPVLAETGRLRAGDGVRVRPVEEIEATLDQRHQLKGCAFMGEMQPYCGTTQRVLKPVARFLDERDYRVKRCSGLVILDGAICEGTAAFGPCDRACFFFWREEWLEKLDSPPPGESS